MLNNFYFDKDAAPVLSEAGFIPLYFDKFTVRIETEESPHWFYHICYYLDILDHEIDRATEHPLWDEDE